VIGAEDTSFEVNVAKFVRMHLLAGILRLEQISRAGRLRQPMPSHS
jgi:hypothetical protein